MPLSKPPAMRKSSSSFWLFASVSVSAEPVAHGVQCEAVDLPVEVVGDEQLAHVLRAERAVRAREGEAGHRHRVFDRVRGRGVARARELDQIHGRRTGARDLVPATVRAGHEVIDLVEGLRPVLRLPEVARLGIEGQPEAVAHAVGEHLVDRIGLVHVRVERIVGRERAVVVHAEHDAGVVGRRARGDVLELAVVVLVADHAVERLVGTEGERAAVVVRDLAGEGEDREGTDERRAVPRVADHLVGGGHVAVVDVGRNAARREVEVHPGLRAMPREVRMHRDAEQPALLAPVHVQIEDRAVAHAARDAPDVAAPLLDHEEVVGPDERQTGGAAQVLHHQLDREPAREGLGRRARDAPGATEAARQQARGEGEASRHRSNIGWGSYFSMMSVTKASPPPLGPQPGSSPRGARGHSLS